jgi:hypothetical protein
MEPFLLVVVDHDKKVFSIGGPMEDDRPWNDAVAAAQEKGRSVNCFPPSSRASRETVAEEMQIEFGYSEAKSILTPKL